MAAPKPEQEARQRIDELLAEADWAVQDRRAINRSAALGVAVREFPLDTGFADYLLFVGGKAVGLIESKTVGGTAEQAANYSVTRTK